MDRTDIPELKPFDESMRPGLEQALAVIQAHMDAFVGVGCDYPGFPDYGQRCKFAGMSQAQADLWMYAREGGTNFEHIQLLINRGREKMQ